MKKYLILLLSAAVYQATPLQDAASVYHATPLQDDMHGSTGPEPTSSTTQAKTYSSKDLIFRDITGDEIKLRHPLSFRRSEIVHDVHGEEFEGALIPVEDEHVSRRVEKYLLEKIFLYSREMYDRVVPTNSITGTTIGPNLTFTLMRNADLDKIRCMWTVTGDRLGNYDRYVEIIASPNDHVRRFFSSFTFYFGPIPNGTRVRKEDIHSHLHGLDRHTRSAPVSCMITALTTLPDAINLPFVGIYAYTTHRLPPMVIVYNRPDIDMKKNIIDFLSTSMEHENLAEFEFKLGQMGFRPVRL